MRKKCTKRFLTTVACFRFLFLVEQIKSSNSTLQNVYNHLFNFLNNLYFSLFLFVNVILLLSRSKTKYVSSVLICFKNGTFTWYKAHIMCYCQFNMFIITACWPWIFITQLDLFTFTCWTEAHLGRNSKIHISLSR